MRKELEAGKGALSPRTASFRVCLLPQGGAPSPLPCFGKAPRFHILLGHYTWSRAGGHGASAQHGVQVPREGTGGCAGHTDVAAAVVIFSFKE